MAELTWMMRWVEINTGLAADALAVARLGAPEGGNAEHLIRNLADDERLRVQDIRHKLVAGDVARLLHEPTE
jgi:hypothetical protein